MVLILDLLVLVLGLSVIVYATLIGKDRRHAGKGLLAVGCYAFLLPIATAIAIAISGRSDDMGRLDFGSTPVLIPGFALVSLVAIPVGLHLLGLRLKGGIWFLIIWNGLGLLILGVGMWSLWTARQCSECGDGELFLAIVIAFAVGVALVGDFFTLIGFLIAGLWRSRTATGRALLFGTIASTIQALPLALRGPIIWAHGAGLIVLTATIAIAVTVFFIARAPSSEQEPKAIGKEYVTAR